MLANSPAENKIEQLMIVNVTANKIKKMLPGKILYVLIICFTFLLTSENSNPKKILQKNKMSLNTILNDLS